MKELRTRSKILAERLGLKYAPCGIMFAGEKPEGAAGFKKRGGGCVAPLMFSAAKGKIVAFDGDSTGYPCSAFYLGYEEWIFPGIEYFLSCGPLPGRECERFVRTPALAKEYVTALKSGAARTGAVIFKPLDRFEDGENPAAVILFADPDRMSALVFLAHYGDPLSRDRIVTGFASACASLFTIPLQYADRGEKKAFWGLHDIAARMSFPKEITSLAMPREMYEEVCSFAEESFLFTDLWDKLVRRAAD